MHWIEDALTNVNIEALNDILRWAIGVMDIFELNIGHGSMFDEGGTIPIFAYWNTICILAMFIVIVGAGIKLYITIASPFGNAEEPGAIFIRTVLAGFGVLASGRIFRYIEDIFNTIYGLFVTVYKGQVEAYVNIIPDLQASDASEAAEDAGWTLEKARAWWRDFFNWDAGSGGRLAQDNGFTGAQTAAETGTGTDGGAFNFLGGESLINSNNMGDANASLGVLILELIIGCALLVCFFRLMLEVYERYVLLGIMYLMAPLAFSSLIQRDSQIFKNWFQMLISQYILMCMNLVFLGSFTAAWYNIITKGLENGYMYETYPEYITTNLALIGWLTVGQKLDQHLKGIGLSTAQTGAGLMGALAGGAVLARGALGMMGDLGGRALRTANGQSEMQRAWRDGTGIPGAIHKDVDQMRQGTPGAEMGAMPMATNPEKGSGIPAGSERANAEAFNQMQQGIQENSAAWAAKYGDSISNFDASSASITGTEMIASPDGQSEVVKTDFVSNVGSGSIIGDYNTAVQHYGEENVMKVSVGGHDAGIVMHNI